MLNKKNLLLAFLAVQLIAIISFILNKHHDFLYETLFIIAGVLLLTYVENKKEITISNYVRTVFYLAVSGHTVGGELFNLYATSTVYDKYLHVLGAYAFGLLGYILLGQPNSYRWPKAKYLLVIAIGFSIGSFYELVEFATDQLSHPSLPAQSGLLDTDLDLLADLLGALLAAFNMPLLKL